MSTTINQDVIKAREVVAGYKELNKNTVEEISYYDPVLKLRRYKKMSIDPNSKDFIKLLCIPKILKNESNSQLFEIAQSHKLGCCVSQRYLKMKAIHNCVSYNI